MAPTKHGRRMVYTDTAMEDNVLEGQHFFPSFAPLFASPPLGHSRPLLYPDNAFRSSVRSSTYRELPADNLLGSGNFGVIKGGTYYAGGDRDSEDFSLDDSYSSSYLGNAHGRPAYYKRNPLPAYRNGGDFFANFRDFADITAPTKSSFSQYYVVYVNKNATANDAKQSIPQPGKKVARNIIEQLAMIDGGGSEGNDDGSEDPVAADYEEEQEQETRTATPPVPDKLSKAKKKLAAYKEHAETKEKIAKSKLYTPSKEIAEPLLALS